MSNLTTSKAAKIRYLLIIGFVGLLILPTIGQLGGFQWTDRVLKRKLIPFPTSLDKHWTQKVMLWHRDHVGFKNSLIVGHNRLKYNVLNTTPIPSKVLVGKESWLFSHFHGDIMNKYMGKFTFKKKQLVTIQKRLESTQAFFNQHGIDFYFAIAPDKYRCAKAYLPDYFDEKELYTYLDQFQVHMVSDTVLQWVDLKSSFPQDYDAADLYRKQDIHWNGIGGYWGAISLLNKIKEKHPSIVLPRIGDFKKDTVHALGSTLRMLNLPDQEGFVQLKAVDTAKVIRLAENWERPPSYGRRPDLYERRFENTGVNNDLKILYFHDSFMGAMIESQNESVQYSIYSTLDFQIDWWNVELVLSEKPDIFVLELSEGQLPYLLSPHFSVPQSSTK